jgi:phosphatidylglycerol---prolipoprotein diacylglyceryl transferase
LPGRHFLVQRFFLEFLRRILINWRRAEVVLTLAMIKPGWRFPVILHLWGWHIYVHQITDFVAYTLAFRYYLFLRRKWGTPRFSAEANAWLLLGCIFGALIGAKILAWTEAPDFYWRSRFDPSFWFGGKTIVGGLLGGWIGIEFAKKFNGITISTGDVCVFPLILGMCIGRIGCFLTGLEDNTCGLATRSPWGVDFGDGISRHPAQLYEIVLLLLLGFILNLTRPRLKNGELFRCFMAGYLGFRFLIEFIKPRLALFAGLSSIQWASLVGLIICLVLLARRGEQIVVH